MSEENKPLVRNVVENIIVKDNKVLLVKRAPWKTIAPNHWSVPAGGIDNNETQEEAVRREMMEETGLEVLEAKYITKYPRPQGGTIFQYRVVPNHYNIQLCKEHTEYRWVSLDEINNEEYKTLWIHLRESIKNILEEEKCKK